MTAAARLARSCGSVLLAAALAGCGHSPPPRPAPGPAALHAAPATEVKLETRGRLRPQYQASGLAGDPLPYENAVQSSLILCAALGPLFGPCAGVLLGGAAVAGVTEAAVASLTAPGSAGDDAETLRRTFAPNLDFAGELGRRIVDSAIADLNAAGDRVAYASTPAPTGCAENGHGVSAVTSVDIVRLEVELEPGYQYRLIVVARARTGACPDGETSPERRFAYRGRLQGIAREQAAARARFEAEIARAVATLGADVAAHVTGRPRPAQMQ